MEVYNAWAEKIDGLLAPKSLPRYAIERVSYQSEGIPGGFDGYFDSGLPDKEDERGFKCSGAMLHLRNQEEAIPLAGVEDSTDIERVLIVCGLYTGDEFQSRLDAKIKRYLVDGGLDKHRIYRALLEAEVKGPHFDVDENGEVSLFIPEKIGFVRVDRHAVKVMRDVEILAAGLERASTERDNRKQWKNAQ